VFFINFEGVTLVAGPDDATLDQSELMPGTYEAYPTVDAIDTIMASFEGQWGGFDVEFTDSRPARGPYEMVVVTPTNPYGAEVPAVGPLDCNDTVRGNVALVFTSAATDPATIAVRASNRLGAMFGVANGTDDTDLSHPTPIKPAVWHDACLPVADPPSACARQAQAHCSSADEQNPAAILVDTVGYP
jgi:hypothetical protein